MAKFNNALLAFNRGVVSDLALARVDLKRLALSAEIQTNFMPRALGPMSLRPGLKYVAQTLDGNAAEYIPFVFSADDTALIELTPGKVRVLVDEELVTRPAVSTSITNSTFTDDGITDLASVAVANDAGSNAYGAGFSPDGQFFASGETNTPYVRIFSVSGVTLTKLADPASLPSGRVNDVAFSHDGQFMALAVDVSPYIEIYQISGTTFTKLSNPATLPAGQAWSVAFSKDDTMLVVGHSTSPFMTLYDISGTTFTKRANPATLPPSSAVGADFSYDSEHLAIATGSSPYISVYDVTGGAMVKLSDPATLPTGAGQKVSYSPNDLLAIAHTTTPFVTVYNRSGDVYTKLSNPSSLPDGNGTAVAFTRMGDRLAVGNAVSPFMNVYDVSGSTFRKRTNPAALPSSPTNLRWSPDARLVVTTHASSDYIRHMKTQTWYDASESGGSSTMAGVLTLTGNGTDAGQRTQSVRIADADIGIEHALNIETTQGLTTLRVGSTAGSDDLISETELGVGNHSLAFTPTTDFIYIQMFNRHKWKSIVASVSIAPAGVMEIDVPWVLDTFDKFRYDQSGDVIFVACETFQQKRIERRGVRSWSTVWYRPEDGPFRPINTSSIRLTPSAISGNITITASKPYFKSTNVGSLFRLTSVGQQVAATITGQDQWTDPIRVTGTSTGRVFALVLTSLTGSGTTVTLQRSVEEPGAWTDVASYTTNQSTTYNDGLDNQIIYYRIGVKTGNYVAGTIGATLTYSAGSISGVARVTAFNSSTEVEAEVLSDLGGTASTADWEEGAWSERRGWPSAVCLHEGRLFWAGKDKIWGSASDAFNSFDDSIEGDSGPINRSIGKGPVDTISWMVSLNRLLIGGQGAEFSAQSSNTDEILTPTTFGLKGISTQGSKGVAAVKVDNSALFVHRGGAKIYEAAQADQFSQYQTGDITSMVPGIGVPGITRIGVQRQPDTRLHCIRSDGTAAILVYDSAEQVKCWVNVETDGWIEGVVVLPGALGEIEDRVYYVVLRTIDGNEVRFLEKWAFEEDCQGGTLNHQADSYVQISQASSTTITGLSRLEGETVVVWANGKDLGSYTVTGGSITVSEAVTSAIVGLPYTAQFKNAKTAYTAALGTPLNQTKKIHGLGVVLKNTHYKGLKYGRDFDNLYDLPDAPEWVAQAANTVYSTLDTEAFDFEGDWSTDTRICLQATAPRPCTVLAVVGQFEQNES